MSRIGVNTRLLIKDRLDGIGWYQYEILKRMVKANPSHQFYFFFDRNYDDSFVFADNVNPIVLRPQARHPLLFNYWFNHSIKKALKKHEIQLFFSPDGFLCLDANVPQIGTIHDLNFEHFPDDLRPSHSRYYRRQFPLFANKANHLITVSNFSKNDIVQQYAVAKEKITTIYNGVNENYKPVSQQTKEKCQINYSEGMPFFLHIGSLSPRKNITRLIQAFNAFKRSSESDVKLILAGNKYDWTPEMEKSLKNSEYKKDIIFTGRIKEVDLIELLGSALALTYVSYFEGFGMPILEAMRTETPVITSNCTSIPEVCGEAALLVDPFNVDEIAMAMTKIASNLSYGQQLIEKGKNRASLFGWDKCAMETWTVIEKSLGDASIQS